MNTSKCIICFQWNRKNAGERRGTNDQFLIDKTYKIFANSKRGVNGLVSTVQLFSKEWNLR